VGRRTLLSIAAVAATIGVFVVVGFLSGHKALSAAVSPDWTLAALSLLVAAAVQPFRALAWSTTLRQPVGFRALYCSSSLGSLLDTLLPGRLGEASKAAVLRVAAGDRWPGLPRAAGSLLCSHMLEACAFTVTGAAGAAFLPLPNWARIGLAAGCGLSLGAIGLAGTLHRKIGHRLPRAVDRFFAGAWAPPAVLAKAGAILLATWVVRLFAIMLMLRSLGVEAGLGTTLVYMIVTGLANTAPVLPGNAGVYQGAAIGALAMAGIGGAQASAVSLVAPVYATAGTGIAAAVGLALYGRRFLELSRAALLRPEPLPA
jgi:Lysylphosphatidylglycerol synthase TM region